jgi:hypothetical protein
VGLEMDEPIWDPTVFTKNRDRLLNQDTEFRQPPIIASLGSRPDVR